MKNINIIIIILSLFFGNCECGRKRVERKYVIENNTNHKIKINVYQYNRFNYSKEKMGKGIIHEGMSNDGTGKMIAAYKALQADSMIIYFDDDKKIIYFQANSFPIFRGVPNNKRNILNDSSYIRESNTLYTYTFSEEDYNNAVNFQKKINGQNEQREFLAIRFVKDGSHCIENSNIQLQIEQGLKGATSWNAWRNNVRNIHDNPTENNLDELYANWH